VSVDRKLKRLNVWVHREYMRLFTRCLATHWPEWRGWPPTVRDRVLRSVAICINGLTASAVTSPRDWPAQRQIEQLDMQLELLRRWAKLKHIATHGRKRPRPKAMLKENGNGFLAQR
jgi:hypothetical protein